MCTVCGCDNNGNNATAGNADSKHSDHTHTHPEVHHHHQHHYGLGEAGTAVPGLTQRRIIEIEQNILSKNNGYAAANRSLLRGRNMLSINLLSSPGSGKTTLLTRTINDLKTHCSLAVVEGDQQTANDAKKIRETGAPAIQINTGKGCHLDAHMVGHAIETLNPENNSLLFIENVGNLVCPAAFDLGETAKVVVLSITEGEDKPIKYPDMFHASNLMLLNKIDLLPYVEFDVNRCINFARQVNPNIKVIQVSATQGDGLDAWYQWLSAQLQLAAVGE